MRRAAVLAVAALVLAACQPYQTGIAHTHHGTPTVGAQANMGRIPVHVVHLMGWGTDNPQPYPGRYNWGTLDQRIRLVTDADAEPVITLCCAPDWMKGGAAGTTNWSRLEAAPLPSRYDDFASLAAATAARYPQVKRFQVWNELKGFHDPARNNWNIAGYTDLYNKVYRAIKRVRPDALIGGPYVPVTIWSNPATMSHPSAVSGPWGTVDQRALDAITYWLTHNAGADFITVDASTFTRDRGLITDPHTATDMYAVVTRWIRARTTLPIWWAEVHATSPSWPLTLQASTAIGALIRLRVAGAQTAILWAPQAENEVCTGCLWWADGTLTPLGQVLEPEPQETQP